MTIGVALALEVALALALPVAADDVAALGLASPPAEQPTNATNAATVTRCFLIGP